MLTEVFQKMSKLDARWIVKLDESEFALFKELEKYAKPFEQAVLTQMFYCIQVDQYEWCYEFKLSNNLFYGKGKIWMRDYEKRFFKWVGAYYILELCAEAEGDMRIKELERVFLLTLGFQKRERLMFHKLKYLKETQSPLFQVETVKYIAKDLFEERDLNIQEVAMVCHLLRNGYLDFNTSFQRYYHYSY